MSKRCFRCGEDLGEIRAPSRQDTCQKCGAYIRCCRNCRFYDRYAHNSCRDARADWVEDKERANFCEFFEFTGAAGSDQKQPPKKKLEDLFRKKQE